MSYFVYILYSEKFDTFYKGQTNNIQERLKRHNAGYVRSTARYVPWKLVWSTKKESRTKAMELETKLKNLSRAKPIAFIKKYCE